MAAEVENAIPIPKHVVDILNAMFGEDIDNLADVEDFLAEYKSKENILAKAIEESEKKTSTDLSHVMGTCETMLQEMESISLKIEEIIDQHVSHSEKSIKMENHLKMLKKSVDDIENEQAYVTWVRDIKSLSGEIESYIQKKNMPCAIASYDKLHTLWSKLQITTCKNLKNFVDENCKNLFDELKKTLSDELNTLLTSMKYPFPTGIVSPHFNKKEETEEQFKNILVSLARLKPLCDVREHSLVTELITEPLQKRFFFHFYGERHTNNPEKPEWYFTQVLNWIRDHSSFLDDYIQPTITENQPNSCDLKREFIKVLVTLVEEKLHDTIDIIRTNDVMLAHLIDETMTFDRELQTCLQTPDPTIGCLYVLLREDFLVLWLELEKKFTFESMDIKLNHEEAWVPKFAELTTTDKNLIYYAPRCVDEFITFLSMMTSRHKGLYDIVAQRKFLDILVTSMYHFVTEMKVIAAQVKCPESQNYCSILNGAYYMFHVLEEWADDLYFLQLCAPVDDDVMNEGEDTGNEKIFCDVLVYLAKFISSLVESIVEQLRAGLKVKLNSYKSETWQALPPLKDYLTPSLSSGACDMMLYIKQHMHLLEEKLCPDIFERVWKQATAMIDHLIFIEVVYEAHFNEGGASQLQFDLKENLFVLFGQYTTRADSYFKLLKDSCILLNLPTGTAYLLREVFEQKKAKEDYEEVVRDSLKDMDIKYLTSSQAYRLINSRIDYWPKIS